jgi:hypothetical protein
MNNAELDTMWFQAQHDAIKAGEDYARYRFAALVAAAEREACADICDQHASIEGIAQRCAAEIRARGNK